MQYPPSFFSSGGLGLGSGEGLGSGLGCAVSKIAKSAAVLDPILPSTAISPSDCSDTGANSPARSGVETVGL